MQLEVPVNVTENMTLVVPVHALHKWTHLAVKVANAFGHDQSEYISFGK